MSAPCPALPRTRRLVAARLTDTISAADGRTLKDHVASCHACAAEALRLDPTLLFAPLAGEPALRSREAEGRRMAADVLAAIEVARTERRFGAGPRKIVLRAASVVLLAGALVGLIRMARHREAAPEIARQAVPTGARDAAPAPLAIEDLHSSGATVYHFAASSSKEPNVIFVVDRNADL